MVQQAPALGQIDIVSPSSWGDFGVLGEMAEAPFKSPVANFYMTDPISRVSETMAACTEVFVQDGKRTGTDG